MYLHRWRPLQNHLCLLYNLWRLLVLFAFQKIMHSWYNMLSHVSVIQASNLSIFSNKLDTFPSILTMTMHVLYLPSSCISWVHFFSIIAQTFFLIYANINSDCIFDSCISMRKMSWLSENRGIASATLYDPFRTCDSWDDSWLSLVRGGPAESAARERSTGSQRRRTTFVGHLRAHGVALGPFDESQHTYEELLQWNRHHDFRTGHPTSRARHLA